MKRVADESLNEWGLFDDRAAARRYLEEYQRELDRGTNLETLDGAVLLEIWEDVAARGLRQTLGLRPEA